MKAAIPSPEMTRCSGKTGRAGAATASVAISGSDQDALLGGAREQLPGLVEEDDVLQVEEGRHRLPGLELACPAAATSGGDAAQQPALTDGHRHVDMAPAELGVDDRALEREALGRRRLVDGRELQVLDSGAEADRVGRRLDAAQALDGLAVVGPDAVSSLERHAVRHADELGDVVGRGSLEDLLRRSELLERPGTHDREPVAERQCLDLVVGHVDGGEVESPVQLVDLGAHEVTKPGVEVRERLVEEHEVRSGDEAARKRDALLLATAELCRVAVEQGLRVDELRDVLDPLLRLRRLDAPRLQRIADVLADGHVRPERIRLEDHPDVPFVGRDVDPARSVEDGAVAEGDLALFRRLETGDATQRRRLAASTRPEQDEELTLVDLEIEVVDSGRRRLPAESLREASNAYIRHVAPPSFEVCN